MRIRLDAQHLLWKLHTGFELHPDIPVMENMRLRSLRLEQRKPLSLLYISLRVVLTSLSFYSIWIFDLATQLPTVQLYGFDISDSQYPSKELWPRNVTLGLLDSLVDPPSSLYGQYDVVHLRMWASILRGNDISLLSRHVKHLLSKTRAMLMQVSMVVYRLRLTDGKNLEVIYNGRMPTWYTNI